MRVWFEARWPPRTPVPMQTRRILIFVFPSDTCSVGSNRAGIASLAGASDEPARTDPTPKAERLIKSRRAILMVSFLPRLFHPGKFAFSLQTQLTACRIDIMPFFSPERGGHAFALKSIKKSLLKVFVRTFPCQAFHSIIRN